MIEEADTVIVSRENVKTFRWKYGRIEDAISIITHYVLTFSVRRTPMVSSNRRGRSGKIIVEQPGGNVAITEGQHRDDYTLCSAMYRRITRHACLFVEHTDISPIIKCLLFNFSILRIRFAFCLNTMIEETWKFIWFFLIIRINQNFSTSLSILEN